MKLKNIKVDELNKLFETIDQCSGNVYLVSPNMNINLKSKIAHYISFVNLCSAGNDEIEEIEIIASERDDIDKLYEFLKH